MNTQARQPQRTTATKAAHVENVGLRQDDFILLPYGAITIIGAPHPVHSSAWEALWSDGKVGYHDTKHTMPKGRKAELKASTTAAIQRLRDQIAEWERGLSRLENMTEKDYEALQSGRCVSDGEESPRPGGEKAICQ